MSVRFNVNARIRKDMNMNLNAQPGDTKKIHTHTHMRARNRPHASSQYGVYKYTHTQRGFFMVDSYCEASQLEVNRCRRQLFRSFWLGSDFAHSFRLWCKPRNADKNRIELAVSECTRTCPLPQFMLPLDALITTRAHTHTPFRVLPVNNDDYDCCITASQNIARYCHKSASASKLYEIGPDRSQCYRARACVRRSTRPLCTCRCPTINVLVIMVAARYGRGNTAAPLRCIVAVTGGAVTG